MGIGHDIRPKKSYHYGNEVVEHKKEEPEIEHASSIDYSVEHEKLEDDFFYDEQKHKNHQLKTEVNRKSPVPKWLAVIFFLALFGMLVYQNYEIVLRYVGLLPEEKSQSSEESKTYTSTASTPTETDSTTTTSSTTTPSATLSTPATTPATTATNTIDKTDITLSVLNGNGIKGSAEEVSQLLKTAGFNPTKVANAKSFSYTETYIYYQTGKSAEAKLVKDALTSRTVVLEESNTLTGSYNVLLVVGRQ